MKSDSVTVIHYGFTLEQAFTQILIAKKPVLHNQFNHMIMLRIYQIIKSRRKESFALKLFTNHTFLQQVKDFPENNYIKSKHCETGY